VNQIWVAAAMTMPEEKRHMCRFTWAKQELDQPWPAFQFVNFLVKMLI